MMKADTIAAYALADIERDRRRSAIHKWSPQEDWRKRRGRVASKCGSAIARGARSTRLPFGCDLDDALVPAVGLFDRLVNGQARR
jgi:hypothetical protein